MGFNEKITNFDCVNVVCVYVVGSWWWWMINHFRERKNSGAIGFSFEAKWEKWKDVHLFI